MEEVLELKFNQHPEVRSKLMETGQRRLIFISKDKFWGFDIETSKGANKLGYCLSKIRDKLRVRQHRHH